MIHDRDAGRYNPFFTRAGGGGGGAAPRGNNAAATYANALTQMQHISPPPSVLGGEMRQQTPSGVVPSTLSSTWSTRSTTAYQHQVTSQSNVHSAAATGRAMHGAPASDPYAYASQLEGDLLSARQLIQTQTNQIETLTSEVSLRRKELTQATKQYDSLVLDHRETALTVRQLRDSEQKTRAALERSEGNAIELGRCNEDLQERVSTLTYRLDKNSSALSTSNDALRQAEQQIESLSDALLKLDATDIVSMRQQLHDAQTERNQYKHAASEAAVAIERLQERVNELEDSESEHTRLLRAAELQLADAARNAAAAADLRQTTEAALEDTRRRLEHAADVSREEWQLQCSQHAALQTTYARTVAELEQLRGLKQQWALTTDAAAAMSTQLRESRVAHEVEVERLIAEASRGWTTGAWLLQQLACVAKDPDAAHHAAQDITQCLVERSQRSTSVATTTTSSYAAAEALWMSYEDRLTRDALELVGRMSAFYQDAGVTERALSSLQTERNDLKGAVDVLVAQVDHMAEERASDTKKLNALQQIKSVQEALIADLDNKLTGATKRAEDAEAHLSELRLEVEAKTRVWRAAAEESAAIQSALQTELDGTTAALQALKGELCEVTTAGSALATIQSNQLTTSEQALSDAKIICDTLSQTSAEVRERFEQQLAVARTTIEAHESTVQRLTELLTDRELALVNAEAQLRDATVLTQHMQATTISAVVQREAAVAQSAALEACRTCSAHAERIQALEAELALRGKTEAALREEGEALSQRSVEAAAATTALTSRIASLEAENSTLLLQYKLIETKVSSYQVETETLLVEYRDGQREVERLRAALAALAASQVDVETCLEETREELVQTQTELDEACSQLATTSDGLNLKKRCLELEDLLHMSQREVEATNQAIASLAERNRTLEMLVASEMNRKSNESESLAKILQRKDATIIALEEQLSGTQRDALEEKEQAEQAHGKTIALLEQEIRTLRRVSHHNGPRSSTSGVVSPRGDADLDDAVWRRRVVELEAHNAQLQRAVDEHSLNEAAKAASWEVFLASLEDRHSAELRVLQSQVEERETELFEASIQATRDMSQQPSTDDEDDESDATSAGGPGSSKNSMTIRRLKKQLVEKSQRVQQLKEQLDRVLKRVATLEANHSQQLSALFKGSMEREADLVRQLRAARSQVNISSSPHPQQPVGSDNATQQLVDRLIATGSADGALAVVQSRRGSAAQQLQEFVATRSELSPSANSGASSAPVRNSGDDRQGVSTQYNATRHTTTTTTTLVEVATTAAASRRQTKKRTRQESE